MIVFNVSNIFSISFFVFLHSNVKGVQLTSAMAAESGDEDDLSINEPAISASEDEVGNSVS